MSHFLPRTGTFGIIIAALLILANSASAVEIMSVPAATVLPFDSGVVYFTNGACVRIPPGNLSDFQAPVVFPHEALILNVTLEAHDSSGGELGGYVELRLVRYRYNSYQIVCDVSTLPGPAPGDVRIPADSFYGHVVDNSEYSYCLFVRINNTTGSTWETEMFYKVIIEYNLASATGTPPDTGQLNIGGLESFPNPFNPSTTIRFDLAQASSTSLTVLDLAGRLVRRLLDDEEMAIGRHEIHWNGRDDSGRSVPTGVYLYHLAAGDHVETQKITLLK